MKSPILPSFFACVAGWLSGMIVLMIFQLSTRGNLSDYGVTVFYIGLFALLGWCLFVAPAITWLARFRAYTDIRMAWLSWAVTAAGCYVILVGPIFGRSVLGAVWTPLVMGAFDGTFFSWFHRPRRACADLSQAVGG